MYKQLAGAIILSCFCASAMADYGFNPIAALAPDAAGARAVAIGDVTGDGRDDVVVLAGGTEPLYFNKVLVYAQVGGEFAPPVAFDFNSESVTVGDGKDIGLTDIDADGDLDIVVSYGFYPAWVTVLRNDDGSFAAPTAPTQTYEQLYTIKFTDANDDGHVDLVGQDQFGFITGYAGDGTARFGELAWGVYMAYPSPFQLADVDGDGREDIVHHHWETIFVSRNEGAGFSSKPRAVLNADVDSRFVASDFNGDHRADLVVSTDYSPRHSILFHPAEGDGTYRRKRPIGSGPGSVDSLHAGDLDGDGRLDLLMLHQSYGGKLSVRLARASGGFSPPVTHEVGQIWDFVPGDVNDDGMLDVVMRGENGGVSYMLGSASAMGTDPAVSLGLNAGAAAVRVENRGDTGTASFELTLHLEPRLGSISAGALPADCHASPVSDGSLYITCQMPVLAPGAHQERIFPFGITASTQRTRLQGTARLDYAWPELRLDNNVATKWLNVTIPAK